MAANTALQSRSGCATTPTVAKRVIGHARSRGVSQPACSAADLVRALEELQDRGGPGRVRRGRLRRAVTNSPSASSNVAPVVADGPVAEPLPALGVRVRVQHAFAVESGPVTGGPAATSCAVRLLHDVRTAVGRSATGTWRRPAAPRSGLPRGRTHRQKKWTGLDLPMKEPRELVEHTIELHEGCPMRRRAWLGVVVSVASVVAFVRTGSRPRSSTGTGQMRRRRARRSSSLPISSR